MAADGNYTQSGLDTSYSQTVTTDTTGAEPIHNTSVMESPSSIASVDIPPAYTDQSQHAPVHPHQSVHNSPSNPSNNQSPHNSINQSPSAAMHNMTSLSPHHSQNTPISQSPHPIQSPHPPMQPSPHHSQSQSPHPSITSPYTNLPHQSPTGSAGYATPAPPTQRQSSSSHSSKSPRASSSRSSQQQQQHQLSSQQQAQQLRLQQHQQSAIAAAHYAQAQQQYHQAVYRGHEPYLQMPNAITHYAQHQAMTLPGVHGHSGHSQTNSNHLSKLHHLTMSQGMMNLPNQTAAAAAVQHSQHAVSHTPPPQKQTKSSKSRSGSSSSSAASVGAPPASNLLSGYPAHMNYHQQMGQVARVGSSASQARAPNVNIPAISMDYNAMQYQMLASNPALLYSQQYAAYDNRQLAPNSNYAYYPYR